MPKKITTGRLVANAVSAAQTRPGQLESADEHAEEDGDDGAPVPKAAGWLPHQKFTEFVGGNPLFE